MNFKDYLKLLYQQFCASKGTNALTEESKAEFMEWLNYHMTILKDYQQYLEYLMDDLCAKEILEINKGPYDSMSLVLDNITPVSPYLRSEFQSLIFLKSEPFIHTKEETLIVPDTNIFMTHDPYDLAKGLTHWDSIHNQGTYDILVGMFGLITDKDRMAKLQVLAKLRHMLADNVTFTYDTFNGNYFAVLKSNRYVRKLVKTR